MTEKFVALEKFDTERGLMVTVALNSDYPAGQVSASLRGRVVSVEIDGNVADYRVAGVEDFADLRPREAGYRLNLLLAPTPTP